MSKSDEDKVDDDITNITTSPTISKKYKKLPRRVTKTKRETLVCKDNIIRKNIFPKEPDHEMSVIDCTPESKKTKTDISKNKTDLKKKKTKPPKQKTLKEMFPKSSKRKVKPFEDAFTLDETDNNYYEENSDDEQMELSDLLLYINRNEQMDAGSVQKDLQQQNTPSK